MKIHRCTDTTERRVGTMLNRYEVLGWQNETHHQHISGKIF